MHESVNHSLSFVSPDDQRVHTQNIENCWLHAKTKLKMQFGTQKHLLQGYLYEFMFMYSIQNKDKIMNKTIITFIQLID